MERKQDRIVRTIPHNIEAEQSVLGCNILEPKVVLQVMAILKPNDFYSEAHKTIFTAMYEAYTNNQPIDYVSLSDILERKGSLESVGGIEYITTLAEAVPSAANFMHYVNIVKRDSTLRKIIRASQEIIELAYSGSDENVLGFAEKSIFDIAQQNDFSNLVHISNVLPDVLDKFEIIDKNGGMIRGVPTGFNELDRITSGFQKSDLILLAARPSVGKTSLAMNFVTNAALKGKYCAVFSLEMPKEQITQRALCSISGVSMEKALSGKLNSSDWKALWEGNKKLIEKQIFIDDSSMNTPTDILSKCRRLKREHGLDLIMIDYLQLMNSGKLSKDSNRQNEIADITRNLKVAARELQVPIILLSQLSREIEKRADHKPVLSDLRESGAIEQDADIVMFIDAPDRYGDLESEDGPNIRKIIIAKHRNGDLADIKVKWIPEITTYTDIGANSARQSLEDLAPPPPPPPVHSGDVIMSETNDEIDF
ncbi:MAG: replicative DNA helicase [Clostridia bacterium]|nr:replicative DNA helicase [Clostridia bacterium]